MNAEQRVKDLAIDLPPPPKAAGNYVPGVQIGNLLFLSGCGPQRADGSYVVGKAGADLSVEQAYAAAQVGGLAMLARIRLAVTSIRIGTIGDNGDNFVWDLAGNCDASSRN